MDLQKYTPFLKEHRVPIILGILGLICLVYGLITYSGQKEPTKDVSFQASQETKSTTTASTKHITVDVEGAVVKPGVYDLASDSRLQEAIKIAGGLRSEADRLQVAQSMNLASKLTDGGKIYIPFEGDKPLTSDATVLGSQSNTLVNINTATSSQVEDLPGIGPVTAKKVIDNRPYSSLSELTQKKVVGTKVFEQIKNMISL